jgi:putative aminopeptidase FrvX
MTSKLVSPPSMNKELLVELLQAHSTPGDEGEVSAILEREWCKAGLTVSRHGKYAVSATAAATSASDAPVLLVCAHMDSPGFAVDAFTEDGVQLVPLGGVLFDAGVADSVLKTSGGRRQIQIVCTEDAEVDDTCRYLATTDCADVSSGDRACFTAEPTIEDDGRIVSPFLDNRLGCWILCEIGVILGSLASRYRVVLGATACEEIGGFGAPVLARAIQPDAVVCVDATYEDQQQNVLVGAGPVLTLSDASVILSPAIRDRLLSMFHAAAIPLQTEVYNYSGTDSRAFPHAGLTCPVYALLLPTRGNHSPCEEGNLNDAAALVEGISMLAGRGLPS